MSCRNKICPMKFKQKSLWDNTIFENVKLSKNKVLQILEFWMQGVSSKFLRYFFEIQKKTLSTLMKKLRENLVKNHYKLFPLIGGDNDIVEIDESKFGKRKYNKGHKVGRRCMDFRFLRKI